MLRATKSASKLANTKTKKSTVIVKPVIRGSERPWASSSCRVQWPGLIEEGSMPTKVTDVCGMDYGVMVQDTFRRAEG